MDTRASDAGAVASLLQEWKRRSGRTFEGLARRSGLSRSTVHRYCNGQSLPESFAPLEALGEACGASRAELAELFRLWSAATDVRTRAVATDAPAENGAAADAAAQEPAPEPAEGTAPAGVRPAERTPVFEPAGSGPAPGRVPEPVVLESHPTSLPARGRPWLLAVWALTVTLVAVYFVVRWYGPTGSDQPWGHPGPPQRVLGPTWQSTPRRVSPDFFGVTMNSTTGTMPSFPVGAVRLWDSGTTWALLEPSRGHFQWSTLDRLVDGARRKGLPVLFTLGGTPGWASPDGPPTPYRDGSRATPPTDLADWDTFVTELATRYAGHIQAYELWVLAPSPQYYLGSAETLVTMTDRAAGILSRTDPDAKIVCPSMGELWDADSREFLTRFAALGGYRHCDVAGVKLFPKNFGLPPETILELTTMIDKTFHDAAVSLPIWSTGTTYRIATATALDEVTARDYAVRLFLVTLYARYERMYFYNWGGRKIPIVLQAEGGPPTTAAQYLARLEEWMLIAKVYACGHGTDDGLPADTYHCRFKVSNRGTRTEDDAELLWTSSGTATVAARADGVSRRLDGSEVPVGKGEPLQVTGEPAFAVYSG
ncbi:MAG TPA: helix-turn-helix domain-containing protein [Kineosporiaceae bacterium]